MLISLPCKPTYLVDTPVLKCLCVMLFNVQILILCVRLTDLVRLLVFTFCK